MVPRRLPCLISSKLLPGARRPGLDGWWVWAPPPGRDLLDQASSYTRNPRSDSGAAGVSLTTLTTIAARAPLQQERVRTRASPLMFFFPGRGSLFLLVLVVLVRFVVVVAVVGGFGVLYWDLAPVNGWVRGEGVEEFQASREGFLGGAGGV